LGGLKDIETLSNDIPGSAAAATTTAAAAAEFERSVSDNGVHHTFGATSRVL